MTNKRSFSPGVLSETEMEPVLTRIPAASHQQAMDWSLALISQGIESTIEASTEGNQWGLLVKAQEYEHAVEVIEQFHAENLNWPWRQKWTRTAVVFDWGSLAWVALIVLFFALGTRAELTTPGAMKNLAVMRGEWWRLFTAIWLHADLAHLASNAAIGFVLLGLAMGEYGTGTGLLASYLAGVGGNLAVYLLGASSHRSLGASGMVMGSLGLLAVHALASWRKGPGHRKLLLSGVAGGVMLFVLLGLAPDTDVLAHLGGFVTGLLLGGLISPVRRLASGRLVDLGAGVVFAFWVIIPWWLALLHAKP
jgi:membrane associated rhomboid family serine protease